MIYIPTWSAILGLVLMFAGGAILSGLVVRWWFLRLAPPEEERWQDSDSQADPYVDTIAAEHVSEYGETIGVFDITSDSIPVYRDDPAEEGWGKRAWEEIRAEGSGPFPVVAEPTALASPAAVDVARSMVEQDQDAAEFIASLAERRIGIMRELTAA